MNSTVNISRDKTVGRRFEGIERRAEKRLELSLPITIADYEGETRNISPNGVYFDVVVNDVRNFSPGKEIMVYIEGIDSKSVEIQRSVWVTVFGVIVRIDDKGFINLKKKLGVALKFSKEPTVFF